jgi:hypothetical protein
VSTFPSEGQVAARGGVYPSEMGRLGSVLDTADSVAPRGMRLVSVHKSGYGHEFEVQAAASVLARGAQARDCGGIVRVPVDRDH